MDLEGHVEILLPRDPGASVEVTLKEPADVTRLLSGRKPAEVMRMVPALYSLCGTAHAAASSYAMETARGDSADAETRKVRECLVLMERAREHLLRIALDWPKLNQEPPDTETARAAMPILPALRAALDPEEQAFSGHFELTNLKREAYVAVETASSLAEQWVFGESLTRWLSRRSQAELQGWIKPGLTGAARLIGNLDKRVGDDTAAVSTVYLSDAGLVLPPESDDLVPETSSLERHRAHPLLAADMPSLSTRYLARLVDLATILVELKDLRDRKTDLQVTHETAPAGVGIAETARGRLTHIAVLRDGKVESYQIVSPTRWNFAKNGIAQRCLEALPDRYSEERLDLANLVLGAIDPCVSHSVRIH
ncbi:nickel-dependent hydrogenase large subunit [Roseibium sp. MMSF_3544]|uniref:nickel-dependent hydrogenase large subunit n=1 Tax=unclassified Roseibium TaxID=2629323 RepID=UPI00273E2138|nr:nickel-dependent hydrogenase large subunit [Roseibium sp. MMSF_3544]